MKKQTILISAFLIAFSAAFALGGVDGASGKTYTLKLSTQLNETSVMVQGFKELAENVKTKSGGRLIIQVYPSAQLGTDEDVIE